MLLLALACTTPDAGDGPVLADPALGLGVAAPAFSLEDVNETSATFGESGSSSRKRFRSAAAGPFSPILRYRTPR